MIAWLATIFFTAGRASPGPGRIAALQRSPVRAPAADPAERR
jgi:hypothetical protein